MIDLDDLTPALIQELKGELDATYIDLASARARYSAGEDIKPIATRTCQHLTRIYQLLEVVVPT